VVGGEPGLDSLGVVVLAAHELGAAAGIADTRHQGRLERVVVACATLGAGEPARDPLDQRLVVDRDLDDRVELEAALLEHAVQRFGLRHRARVAVEDEALRAVGLVDALGDDAVDDLVRDQLAALHHRLGLAPHIGAFGDRFTQHLAGRELRDAVGAPDPRGLCALPRAGRPQQDQSHPRLLPVGPS
jgi:hypothetical protein